MLLLQELVQDLDALGELAGLEMQGGVLGEGDGDGEDGVVAIGDGGGVAAGGGGRRRRRRISALHGEIEESEHKSNGENEGFWGKKREREEKSPKIE